MKPTIKTGLVAILLLAISCTKNNTIQSSRATDESSTSDIITFNNDPGKYTWVQIGTQKWMATNLFVSHYRNGDKIPQVKDAAEWAVLTTGAWCWYNNDSATGAVYGKLYNWYAVNDPRGLAPTGWHVSSDAEWHALSVGLGAEGDFKAGGKLKDTGTIEAGTGLWYAPNTKATNSSGFTGLPGGWRVSNGTLFKDIGYYGRWWTSTEANDHSAVGRSLRYDYGSLLTSAISKHVGFSVRCLRD